jgi:hypothetical protein
LPDDEIPKSRLANWVVNVEFGHIEAFWGSNSGDFYLWVSSCGWNGFLIERTVFTVKFDFWHSNTRKSGRVKPRPKL